MHFRSFNAKSIDLPMGGVSAALLNPENTAHLALACLMRCLYRGLIPTSCPWFDNVVQIGESYNTGQLWLYGPLIDHRSAVPALILRNATSRRRGAHSGLKVISDCRILERQTALIPLK